MKLKSRIYNGTLYVLLCGELDEHSASYVREEMDKAFSSGILSRL